MSLVDQLSLDERLSVAVQRAGVYYKANPKVFFKDPGIALLSNESLGVSLLVGEIINTSRYIRVGTMVLSASQNNTDIIISEAIRLNVQNRLSHIAKLAISYKDNMSFWERIIAGVGDLELLPADQPEGLFPGLSRFISETRMSGFGRGPVGQWLKIK